MNDFGGSWRRASGFGGSQVSVINISAAAAPSNPLQLFGTDLICWWLADTGVTTSTGNVTAVADQSGNGYNLSNTGTVPFNATGFNSKPAFDFAAGNQAALNTAGGDVVSMGTGTAGAAYFVGQMKTGTASDGGAIVVGYGAQNDYGTTGDAAWLTRSTTTNQIQTYRAGNDVADTAISLATNYRIGAVFDGATLTHYVNNVAGSSGSDNNSWHDPLTVVIGNRFLGGVIGGTSAWDGPISEVVILKIAPNGTQRTALDDWFKYKWGL